jgi:hypothetical protein
LSVTLLSEPDPSTFCPVMGDRSSESVSTRLLVRKGVTKGFPSETVLSDIVAAVATACLAEVEAYSFRLSEMTPTVGGGADLSSSIFKFTEALLAARPSALSFSLATLLGREFGLPDQLVSRFGGVKGRLVPEICESGREVVDGCLSRRGFRLRAGEAGSDISCGRNMRIHDAIVRS